MFEAEKSSTQTLKDTVLAVPVSPLLLISAGDIMGTGREEERCR